MPIPVYLVDEKGRRLTDPVTGAFLIAALLPDPAGPGVDTTLTRPCGPAFTERLFQEALKYRKPPPPPPRELTAKEAAQAKLDKTESRVKLLQTTSFYGSDDLAKAVADRVRAELKQARKDRDHEYYMEVVNKAWDEFKKK